MKLRPFELSLVVGFAILTLLAITTLALYKPTPDPTKDNVAGVVTIWGTLPEAPILALIDTKAKELPALREVIYRYVKPENFETELIAALADRTPPDLVLISQEELVAQRARLAPFLPEALSLRDFRDRYLDAGDIFALQNGVYALPIGIDPLVMYWNRNLFQDAGMVAPPRTWEALMLEVVPNLVKRDFDRTIRRSVVAFGETTNVRNAYPVLSMLLLQSGSQLVAEKERGYSIMLNQAADGSSPLAKSLDFFMRFSNPNNPLYSWNRSLALDRDQFVSEDLALYFGFGSEARDLGNRNPNLNYDIAEVPQGEVSTVKRTYGRVYGLGVVRNGQNLPGAYTVLGIMTEPGMADSIASQYGMAPATRAALAAGTNDVYGRVIYSAALSARGWLSPSVPGLTRVWEKMVTTAGADHSSINSVASDAILRLGAEY